MKPLARTVVLALGIAFETSLVSAQTLTNGLIAYWPLDQVQGAKTPDVVNGYDMDLNNLTASDLVDGKRGKAFSFDTTRKTLLSRVHSATDELPANKHDSFTVCMWTMVDYANQLDNGSPVTDRRVFSEASTTSSDPLFNIGTHTSGADASVDLYLRQSGWTTVNHIHSTAQPFDGQWHHIAFVQEAGVRRIYIDGVLDDLQIPDKPAGVWKVNDTTIGGILRASASHQVTGLIDDVAIWKRALTEAEIGQVITQGIPAVSSNPLPLEIRKFAPEFLTVAKGDSVVLHWDVTKDATITIDQGIGNVSASTVAGVGSMSVPINQTTTFTLTATRGSQSISAQATVGVLAGAASGWHLLENFQSYPAGSMVGKGPWKNPEGEAHVLDLGANKVLGFNAANNDNLSALDLQSLTLKEGQKATLFFRVYASTSGLPNAVGINLGLTDRPIRFSSDFDQNVGPYLRFEKADVDSTLTVNARNGVGAGYEPAATTLEYGKVYNVWIDIENKPFDLTAGTTGDSYSVYVQAEGQAARTLLFQDFAGDRNPNGDADTGGASTNLNSLAIVERGAGQATDTVLFDDFFLSNGAFNSTAPVSASSFTKSAAAPQFLASSLRLNRGAKTFSFDWQSEPGAVYNIEKKNSLTDAWANIGTVTGGAGASSSFTDPNASGTTAFYRVSR